MFFCFSQLSHTDEPLLTPPSQHLCYHWYVIDKQELGGIHTMNQHISEDKDSESISSCPEPHNLIGELLQKKGDHISAMKHFRAAWALEPTYIPVRYNLHVFASFYTDGKCAYDESDCPIDEK